MPTTECKHLKRLAHYNVMGDLITQCDGCGDILRVDAPGLGSAGNESPRPVGGWCDNATADRPTSHLWEPDPDDPDTVVCARNCGVIAPIDFLDREDRAAVRKRSAALCEHNWQPSAFRHQEECKKCHSIRLNMPPTSWARTVDKPDHYNQGEIECIDAMRSAFGEEAVRTWARLNAFKYVWRGRDRGVEEADVGSAIWYLRYSIGDDPRKERKQ